ncbi:MAG: pyrroline-5-carboxylate reductase [Algisphaera sp.]
MKYQLGLIGAGNMAEAIARGAIDRGVLPKGSICAADPSPERRALFESFGVVPIDNNAQVVAQSQSIMLAIKPQILGKLAGDFEKLDRENQTVISIMAGLGSVKIEAVLGGPARVVRVMPNTPLMVGHGMAGVALGVHAKPGDDALAMELFGACGEAVRVAESDLDAVTAVSGSGPAYLFYLAQAMEQAAVDLGLSKHARQLVAQTLLGSAELLAQSPDDAATLRDKVTSPGGTTAAAIAHFDAQGVAKSIVGALTAARDRSVELGAD